MISECMSKNTRRNAGMGDPPLAFYTNDSESANAVIKRAVKFKENEMSDFVREMSVLMQQQKDDVESAIFNKGPYQLAPSFRSFYVAETDWFKKRNEQRDRHMEKFHKARFSKEKEAEVTASSSAPINANSPSRALSVNLRNTHIPSLPSTMLQSLVRKSEELLNRPGSITSAPGNSNAFMVESQTSTRPHFVEIKKNGKVVCNDCPSYASAKFCSHAVAASEKAGQLEKYVKWFTKNGPATINLTSFVTYDSSKNTGKKISQASRGKRKGGRSNRVPPVTSIVDRPFDRNVSAQGFTQAAQAQPSTPHLMQEAPPTQHSVATEPAVPTQNINSQFLHQPTQALFAAPCSTQQGPTAQVLQSTLPPVRTSFTPQPSSGTFQLHLLQYCPRAVRVCFGCFHTLKPDNFVPQPPHDITIVSRMPRSFPSPTTGEMMTKEGNVYFHANCQCIRAKQPYFQPNLVIVQNWVKPLLTMEHVVFLRQFGMRI